MGKSKLRPVVKIHGGKFFLCEWVIGNFPDDFENMTYIEPFAGAASTLCNKKPSKEEVISDLDKGIYNILKVVRDDCQEFISRLKKVKYTKETFETALLQTTFDNKIDMALNEFILRRMSRGGLKTAFAWSNRKRGDKPGDQNAWETILKILPIISKRLQYVYILNQPALSVLSAFNDPGTFVYVDPPYLPETRVSTKAYECEMTVDDHLDLAAVLKGFKGKVLLSGYPSPLYNRLFKDWRCAKKKIANHASQQKNKDIKTECLWANY